MKPFLAFIVLLVAVLVAPAAAAEPSSITSWYFRVGYPSGQFSESVDPATSGPILMYTGATWRCSRTPVSLTKEGALMAGFTCQSTESTQFVTVLAFCHATKQDADSASAGVGDSNGWVRLIAMCSTKPVAPKAPTKSIEKNL